MFLLLIQYRDKSGKIDHRMTEVLEVSTFNRLLEYACRTTHRPKELHLTTQCLICVFLVDGDL